MWKYEVKFFVSARGVNFTFASAAQTTSTLSFSFSFELDYEFDIDSWFYNVILFFRIFCILGIFSRARKLVRCKPTISPRMQ